MFKKNQERKNKRNYYGLIWLFVYGFVNWKQLSIDVDNKVIRFYSIR